MKKLPSSLPIVLIAILNCLYFSTTVTAKTFSDIDFSHQNYNAINYLSTKNIIKGYEDGTFKPDQEITRAELTKMILTGKNLPIKKHQANCFPDVGYLEWYGNYICTAKEAGYIKGYDDGTFKPEQLINKAEALKIISKAYEWKFEFDETPGAFSDTPYDSWYIDYVLYGIEKNLFRGFDDADMDLSSQLFEPGKFITRGEVTEILYRYLAITELNKYSYYPGLEKDIKNNLPKEKIKEDTSATITELSDPPLPTLAIGELKIVLSWEIPKKTETHQNKIFEPKIDFDSHLIEPTDEEIDFSHKLDSKLETILEVKENIETINILKTKKDEKEKDQKKTYLYFANNYSGDKNFAEANVKVEIYDQNGLAKTFYSYNNPEKIWKLFELNENHELTIFNSIGGCELIDRNSTVCPFIPEP